MKTIIAIIGFLLPLIVNAQDYDSAFSNVYTAYQTNNVEGMIRYCKELRTYNSDDYAADAFLAYAYCLKNDPAQARKHINVARNLNPIDVASYNIAAYVAWLSGRKSEAIELMHLSYQVAQQAGMLQYNLDDIDKIAKLTGVDMSDFRQATIDMAGQYDDAPEIYGELVNCVENWQSGKVCNSISKYKEYYYRQSVKSDAIAAYADFLQGTYLYNAGSALDAKNYLTAYVRNPAIANHKHMALPRAKAYDYLAAYYLSILDYDAAYFNAKKAIDALQVIGHVTTTFCTAQHRLAQALAGQGKQGEAIAAARSLLESAQSINYDHMAIAANNTIGSQLLVTTLPAQRKEAYERLTAAYDMAVATNDPQLSDIMGNYAIALWQNKEKDKALQLSTQSFEQLEKDKAYSAAQLTVNNMGFMALYNRDYNRSATLFKKAISITEKYRNKLPAYQRLAVMNEHTSAYSGLIMSYKELGDVRALFEIQDLNRSRLLREQIDQDAKASTLAATQRQLETDEVLLSYSLASAGEMIVSVVTNDNAAIEYNYPIDDWILLKKQMLNRINKKPNAVNGYVAQMNEEIIDGQIIQYKDKNQAFKGEDFQDVVTFTRELLESSDAGLQEMQSIFLRQWYDFLIAPVEGHLTGKRKVIISTEGVLNYLPFESFLNEDGRYVIEDYNVQYIPSATVWASLHNRNYSDDRLPLLAMGGATYEPYERAKGSVRSMDDLLSIKERINEKIGSTKTLSAELKALGFGGANYLPGTLKEVQNLQSIIPEAKVLIDQEMKESDLKSLNASGDLAKYKWVHIATHGFAMDDIPALSGVMMTQPKGGDGQEDMFLLTHEIAQLNLNADLAVLSACETALGKIYGGEGVNGLNSALLVAGANNTLLSLWPVNDAGTMIMMTVAYEFMYKHGFSVEEAINETKRRMLKGEFGEAFRSPVMWAPFVLNGK